MIGILWMKIRYIVKVLDIKVINDIKDEFKIRIHKYLAKKIHQKVTKKRENWK